MKLIRLPAQFVNAYVEIWMETIVIPKVMPPRPWLAEPKAWNHIAIFESDAQIYKKHNARQVLFYQV